MTEDLDYLAHLRAESARFVEVLREAEPGVAVPSCPDWETDDLLWHLGEVQSFWATIVEEAVTDPSDLEKPDRPTDREGLLAFYDAASAKLQRVLAETDPAATRWTWAEEQTAGFIRRRQAHEALIHRVDAELTTGADRMAIDAALATDGVDETLRIMFAGVPAWGHLEPDPEATVRFTARDSERSWLVTLGRFTGTDPDGVAHDEPDLTVADTDPGEDTAATLSGTAADLDCYLWGRPPVGRIEHSGDEAVLAGLLAIIGQGID
jgi:uncharacterized protein (TIGR03083 family)